MKAIEILLRKSVADLSSVTVAGDPDAPLQIATKVELAFDAIKAQIKTVKNTSG